MFESEKDFTMSITSSEWNLFHKNQYNYFVENDNQTELKNLYNGGVDGTDFNEYDSLNGFIAISSFWCDERKTYFYTPIKILSNIKRIPSINWSNGYVEAFTLTKNRKIIEIGFGHFKVIRKQQISKLMENYLDSLKYKEAAKYWSDYRNK